MKTLFNHKSLVLKLSLQHSQLYVSRPTFWGMMVATATLLSHLKYMETRRRFDRRCPRTMGKSGFKGDRKIPGRETYSSAIQKRLFCFLPSPIDLIPFWWNIDGHSVREWSAADFCLCEFGRVNVDCPKSFLYQSTCELKQRRLVPKFRNSVGVP